MARTQEARQIGLTTELDEDALLVRGFSYAERLDGMWSMELDLLSEDTSISFDDIVGTKVTVALDMREDETRYLNGYVVSFRQVEGVSNIEVHLGVPAPPNAI